MTNSESASPELPFDRSSRVRNTFIKAGAATSALAGVLFLGNCAVDCACAPTGEMTEAMKRSAETRDRVSALVDCLAQRQAGRMTYMSDAGRSDVALDGQRLILTQHLSGLNGNPIVHTFIDGLPLSVSENNSKNPRIAFPKVDGVFDFCYEETTALVDSEIQRKGQSEVSCDQPGLGDRVSQALAYCESVTDIILPDSLSKSQGAVKAKQ